MKIQTQNTPLPVSPSLLSLIQRKVDAADIKHDSGLVIHFRDPAYSSEYGGFHPIEIALDNTGRLLYITDFAYVGSRPFVELAKELDFDFQCARFQHFDRDYAIQHGRSMFLLWQRNFLAYVEMRIYDVSVEGG